MTNEQPESVELKSIDFNLSYLQFQIPGYPYSAIRAPLTPEDVDYAVSVAVQLQAALDKAFGGDQHEETRETLEAREDDGRVTYDRPPQRAQQRAPMARPRPHDAPAFCPEHDMAPMRFSAPQYNPDGDKMYHQLDERDWREDARGALVKNHTMWWRQTVDADGNSNDGVAMPAPARR